jgi:hypothetical protein
MSAASNPADVRLDIAHVLKCDLKDLLILAGAVVLGGALLAFDWRASLVAAGIGVAVVLVSIYQTRQAFQEGDVCPAVVLDAKRHLVAVGTDLSKGGKPYPVVKVLKQPLGRVTGGPFEDRARLAFVAMYNGFAHEKRWRNFGGYLVNSGTTNEKTVRRVLRSIEDEQWQWLEAAVEQLDEPYRAGLYEDLEV